MSAQATEREARFFLKLKEALERSKAVSRSCLS